MTDTEIWDAKPEKQKKKIIAAEKKAKKAYKSMKDDLMELQPNNKTWANLFKIFDKTIDADVSNRHTEMLAGIYKRAKNPELSRITLEAGRKRAKSNRTEAATFLGIKYRPKKGTFVFKKVEKRSLHAMVQFMAKDGEDVSSEFVLGQGWRITKGDSVFGPCPV